METAAVLFCFLRGRAGTWRGNVIAHAPSPRLPPSPAEVRLPPRLPVLRGPRRWGRRCLRCEGPAVAVQRVRCEEPRRQHTTGPSHVHPSSPPPPRKTRETVGRKSVARTATWTRHGHASARRPSDRHGRRHHGGNGGDGHNCHRGGSGDDSARLGELVCRWPLTVDQYARDLARHRGGLGGCGHGCGLRTLERGERWPAAVPLA